MLAIVKAAREYIKLGREKDQLALTIQRHTERQDALLKQWGEPLTATVGEMRETEKRRHAEGA